MGTYLNKSLQKKEKRMSATSAPAISAPYMRNNRPGIVQRKVAGSVSGFNAGSLPEKTTSGIETAQLNKKGRKGGRIGGTILGGAGIGLLALALTGPIGGVIGLVGGAIVGYKKGGDLGDWLTGPNKYSELPEENLNLQNLMVGQLKAGTYLFHGTRWKSGQDKWWLKSIPNSIDKDDGGVCFTRDPSSTPKVRNADIIIQYVLNRTVKVVICRQKGEFKAILEKDPNAVVYAPAEQEVRFNLPYAQSVLKYDTVYEGNKRGNEIV